MIFEHGGHRILYEIKKSNRKSIELQIKADALLLIKGPKNISVKQCEDVMLKKWEWLLKNIEKMKRNTAGLEERTYEDRESFLLLGEAIELVIHRHFLSHAKIKKMKSEWVMAVPEFWKEDEVMSYLMIELKKILKEYIKGRVSYYQDQFSKNVNQIVIRNQSTRWGSCSSKKNLNFNYRLVFAPLEVIDYLVVHEMSHLEHMNHSKQYWEKVYEVMPDYKEKDTWLKDNGGKLSLRYKT